jgi:hypothetical protein
MITDRRTFVSVSFSFSCQLCVLCVFVVNSFAFGDDPCRSGLEPGQKPGPYAAVIATGPQRGQSFCYVCETGDHPAVVVFARTLSDPLAQLVRKLDQAVADRSGEGLRAWVTFLRADQPDFDSQVVQWAQRQTIRSVPLGIFEETGGPPSYRLGRDADITVLLYANRRVVANFAFRSGELTDDRIAEILKALPRTLSIKDKKP